MNAHQQMLVALMFAMAYSAVEARKIGKPENAMVAGAIGWLCFFAAWFAA